MSLRHKLFVSYAVSSALILSVVFLVVEYRVREQVESDVLAELRLTEAAFREQWRSLEDRLVREGTIAADAPKLKAAVDTRDPSTVAPVAAEYRDLIGVQLFELWDPDGNLLARFGDQGAALFQQVSIPILLGAAPLGTLTVGYRLDQSFVQRMKRLVNAEIGILSGDRLVATTLGEARIPGANELHALTSDAGPKSLELGDESYLGLSVTEKELPATRFVILRSLDQNLRFLGDVRRDLLLLGMVMTGVALLAGYVTARTLTNPLNTVVGVMGDVARSGDLTRQIRLESSDPETSLLASTFNHLAQSLDTFQKKARQEERLSSLGRLSATLAHEIRNPLTIIKGSALQLLDEESLGSEEREAVSDILQEVERLNALVDAVLDSARPATFHLEEVVIHPLCREIVSTLEEPPRIRVECSWDPGLETVRIDPARLRQVLWNLLLNARQAITGSGVIGLYTRRNGDEYEIRISDSGRGIEHDDLPNVFDPFFTRKPTGTGLGLAVARNIVEGLGGRISMESQPAVGTEVTLTLPLDPRLE